MNGDFDMVPSVGGDLQPFSPSAPLAPSPSPGGFPDYYINETNQPYPPDAPLPGQLFGVPVPGATGQQVEALILRPIVNDFLAEARRLGIHTKYSTAAANWLLTHAFTLPSWEAASHHYSIAGIPISEADMPYVVSFLNEMARVDADPPTVRIFLSYWWNRAPKVLEAIARQHQQQPARSYGMLDDLTDAELDIVERRSFADRDACENVLRERWGNRYRDNLLTVQRYVSKLPAQDKQFVEQAVAKGGQLMINDPDIVEQLYMVAVGVTAPSADVEAEIKLIESKMNSKEYRDSDVMQARYRELIRRRNGG